MNPLTLICMVGLPRSGKTTWALTAGHPIVSPDAIRLAHYGQRFWSPGESMVWAIAKQMAASLFIAGHRTVILDACNTTLKRRDPWKSFSGYDFFDHGAFQTRFKAGLCI